MTIIDQLIYKITGDTSNFDKSITTSQSKVKSFSKVGVAALTALSTGAIAVATKKMFDLAEQAATTLDTIDKMSQKIGISTEAYQEWDFILSQSGASVSGLQTSMKTLSNAASEAADGTAEYADEFDRLGITVTDTDGTLKDTETLFNEVFAALSDMDDQTQRTATAAALLGRSATELAPALNSSSEEIEEMREQSHELGLVMNDEAVEAGVALTDSLDQLKRKFTTLKTEAMLPVIDVMNSVIQKMLGQESATDDLNAKSDEYKTTLETLLDPNINLTAAEEARLKILKEIQAQNLAESVYETQRAFTQEKEAVEEANNNLIKLEATEKAYALVINDSETALERYKDLKDKDNLTVEEQIEKTELFNALADTQFQRQTKLLTIGDEINAQREEANSLNTKYNATLDAITLAVINGTANIDQYAISNKDFYDSVMANVEAVKAKKEAQDNATLAAKEAYGTTKDFVDLSEKELSALERLAKIKVKTAKSDEEAAYWTDILTIAQEGLNDATEETTDATEDSNEAEENRATILKTLEDSVNNIKTEEKLLGDQYDENSTLSGAYLTAIEDLIKNGEDPQSEKLQELIKLYTDLNPIVEDNSEQIQQYKDDITALIESGLDPESEAVQELLEKLKALGGSYEFDKETLSEWDEWIKKLKEGVSWVETLDSAVDAVLDGFEDAFTGIGEALYSGEDAWAAFASAGLDAMSDILTTLGDELAARALVSLLSGDVGGATLAGAGSIAAYTASGLASAAAATYEVGTIDVPKDMTANIHEGEAVLTKGIAEEARENGITIEPSSNSGNSGNTVVKLYVGQKELGTVVLEAINKGSCGTLNSRIVK